MSFVDDNGQTIKLQARVASTPCATRRRAEESSDLRIGSRDKCETQDMWDQDYSCIPGSAVDPFQLASIPILDYRYV